MPADNRACNVGPLLKGCPVPKPNCKDYLFKDIPADLWTRAQEKGKALRPPVSMRWVLIMLLEQWVKSPTAETPPLLSNWGGPAPAKPQHAPEQGHDPEIHF